jgi:hypothetical protein
MRVITLLLLSSFYNTYNYIVIIAVVDVYPRHRVEEYKWARGYYEILIVEIYWLFFFFSVRLMMFYIPRIQKMLIH